MRVLEPPEEVLNSPSRQEVFRGWIDGGMLSVSICNVFPESDREDVAEIWGMLIADIFHHVVDAIVLETGRARKDVKEVMQASLDEIIKSAESQLATAHFIPT